MATQAPPSSSIDLFADDVLADPYPYYRELRNTAPIVYLKRSDLYALPRYDEVRAALVDWETFSSAGGTAFNEITNQMVQGSVEFSDPPDHDRLRAILAEWISPRRIRTFIGEIEKRADALVSALSKRGEFNASTELARAFPALVVTELVGLPDELGDTMVDWGAAMFQCFGPNNERFQASLPIIEELYGRLVSMTKDDLKAGSMGHGILEAVEAGALDKEKSVQLLFDSIGPSTDTTISAITTAIWQLGLNPNQWDLVRNDTSLVPSAANEALRFEAPIPFLSRVTRRKWTVDGTTIPVGARVALMYASANRDERRYGDPDRFDIQRNANDHLAFGFGLHACLGSTLARAQIHAILQALAKRVSRIEVGDAVRLLNNNNRGVLKSLPMKLIAG